MIMPFGESAELFSVGDDDITDESCMLRDPRQRGLATEFAGQLARFPPLRGA